MGRKCGIYTIVIVKKKKGISMKLPEKFEDRMEELLRDREEI